MTLYIIWPEPTPPLVVERLLFDVVRVTLLRQRTRWEDIVRVMIVLQR
jgi:hypothetical protein